MTEFQCVNCQKPFSIDKFSYKCSDCGGLFDIKDGITFDYDQIAFNLPRMWRYRYTFGLPIGTPIICLGEGDTPLITSHAFGHEVNFKVEYLNPTSSFKDRGTALIMSLLVVGGIEAAVEDSSGNAGASFSAYAARAGISAKVFIPDYASGPKRSQIEAYGAHLEPVNGPRSAAAAAVLKAVEEEGEIYASHAYLPQGMVGYATIAYELEEQLGEFPGTVIAPVGHGNLLLGIARGFDALKQVKKNKTLPVLIGVQARACAPLWELYSQSIDEIDNVVEGETLAEGVRVREPNRGKVLLDYLQRTSGRIVVVDESDILPGSSELARLGFYVEPTSAIVWNALEQVVKNTPKPIVVILTGSGLKSKK
jgi:threonine synthase